MAVAPARLRSGDGYLLRDPKTIARKPSDDRVMLPKRSIKLSFTRRAPGRRRLPRFALKQKPGTLRVPGF
jgi:hypothetical protein